MDIPPYKSFDRNIPFDVHTNTGIAKLFPVKAIRGEKTKRHALSIEGWIPESVQITETCYITFKGQELKAHFSQCRKVGGEWIATLQTVIPIPEFWGDQNPPE